LLPDDVAKTAADLQMAHTEGAEKEGLIEDYLNRKLPDEWEKMEPYERASWLSEEGHMDGEGERVRDKVCALEIWCEALGGKKSNFTNASVREINTIMQAMEGWKPYVSKDSKRGKLRFGNYYGIQRAFIREGSSYDR
jgi:hypothetical protein